MSFRTCLIVAAALTLPLPAILASGCGSSVTVGGPDAGEGSGGGPYVFLDGGNTEDANNPDSANQPDGFDAYYDPGCPDAGGPIYDYECDPYHQYNGDCPWGEACYIYVQYPDEPCGQEIYGAYCYPAGSGTQGDSCAGSLDCAPNFVCVVSGSGNQCVQLCYLTGEDGCPPGLVCEPIDVEGYGGCI